MGRGAGHVEQAEVRTGHRSSTTASQRDCDTTQQQHARVGGHKAIVEAEVVVFPYKEGPSLTKGDSKTRCGEGPERAV